MSASSRQFTNDPLLIIKFLFLTMDDTPSLKLGLIDCGNFGQFCLDAYSGMNEVELVAVTDIDNNLAQKFIR